MMDTVLSNNLKSFILKQKEIYPGREFQTQILKNYQNRLQHHQHFSVVNVNVLFLRMHEESFRVYPKRKSKPENTLHRQPCQRSVRQQQDESRNVRR